MDLLLSDNHDLEFINGVASVTPDATQALIQRLKIKLLTFYSEWFLNTEIGVPYYEGVFGKHRVKSTVDSIFRTQILSEKKVQEITYFNSTLSTDRRYSLVFRVKSVTNDETDEITINIGI